MSRYSCGRPVGATREENSYSRVLPVDPVRTRRTLDAGEKGILPIWSTSTEERPAFWIARKMLVYGIHYCERRIPGAGNETGYVKMMECFGGEPEIVARSE